MTGRAAGIARKRPGRSRPRSVRADCDVVRQEGGHARLTAPIARGTVKRPAKERNAGGKGTRVRILQERIGWHGRTLALKAEEQNRPLRSSSLVCTRMGCLYGRSQLVA